jgi:hypothetical protein
LQQSPGAAVSFLWGVMVLPFVLFLLWYHMRVSGSGLYRTIVTTEPVGWDEYTEYLFISQTELRLTSVVGHVQPHDD